MSQSSSLDFESLSKWSISDVGVWLKRKGHDQRIITSCIQEKIDGKSLLLMTESDLKGLPAIQVLYFSFANLLRQLTHFLTIGYILMVIFNYF